MRLKFSLTYFFTIWVMVLSPVLSKTPQAETQAYFTALPDIPLMPLMAEIEDQTFVFDKAEGKVVESVGFLSVTPPEKVLHFYQDALKSLGWKPISVRAFIRNNEQIILEIERVPQGTQVRFRLSPQPLPLSR